MVENNQKEEGGNKTSKVENNASEKKALEVDQMFSLLHEYKKQLSPFFESKEATRELYKKNKNRSSSLEDHATRMERDQAFMSTLPDVKALIESGVAKTAFQFPDGYKPPKLGRGATPEIDSRMFAAEAAEHEAYRLNDKIKEDMLKSMEEQMMASCEGEESREQCLEAMQEKLEAFRSRDLFMRGNGEISFMNSSEFRAYKDAAEKRFKELYEMGRLERPSDRNIMSVIKSLFNAFSTSNLMSDFKPIPFGHEAMRFELNKDFDASGKAIFDKERLQKMQGDISNEYVEILKQYHEKNPVQDLNNKSDNPNADAATIAKDSEESKSKFLQEKAMEKIAVNRVVSFTEEAFSLNDGKPEISEETKKRFQEVFEHKEKDPEKFERILDDAKELFLKKNPDKKDEAEEFFKKMLKSETFNDFMGGIKSLLASFTEKVNIFKPEQQIGM